MLCKYILTAISVFHGHVRLHLWCQPNFQFNFAQQQKYAKESMCEENARPEVPRKQNVWNFFCHQLAKLERQEVQPSLGYFFSFFG